MKQKTDAERKKLLADVQARMSETAKTFGGQTAFWKCKEGRSIIRILPPVGNMESAFWQEVGKHYIPGAEHSLTCPKFTAGLDCPVCEYVDELYKAGDDASKELAGKLRVSKQYWVNIIDRENEDAGPQVYTPGPSVFKSIYGLVADPEYGDIYDPYEGWDLVISRTGQGINTEYEVQPRARGQRPLSEDEDTIDAWLDAAKDLSVVELSDNPAEDEKLADGLLVRILPYDRLSAEFYQEGDGESDEPFPEDEEEEVPAKRKAVEVVKSSKPETRKLVTQARAKRSKR